MKQIGHFINGEMVAGASGRTGPVYNPATGEQTGEVTLASIE
jgi:malonate-semialdehyde dehydrogenase (acetylating)/methylmalonate-semialdehyde dehydrogenase